MPPEPTDEQVRAFVADRFGAVAAATLTPAGSGEWSRAFAWRGAPGGPAGPARELVIRFGRHRADFAKDAIMGEIAGAAGVPVPRVREIGETPWGHFAVSDRRNGTALDDLDGAGMRAALPALLRALGAIAGLPPPGTGFGPWDAGGTAPHRSWRDALMTVAVEQPRTAGWRERLATRPRPSAVFARGLADLDERLRALQPAGAHRRIVHGDLLSRNVLVAGPSVTAVLDWGNALYGDPLYDLAWLEFWWPWYPAWSGIDIGDEIRAHLGSTGAAPADAPARLAAYRLHIGLDSVTYNAFRRRWDVLDRVADQVDSLIR